MQFYSSSGKKIDIHKYNTFVLFYIRKTSTVRRLMVSSLHSNSYIDTPRDSFWPMMKSAYLFSQEKVNISPKWCWLTVIQMFTLVLVPPLACLSLLYALTCHIYRRVLLNKFEAFSFWLKTHWKSIYKEMSSNASTSVVFRNVLFFYIDKIKHNKIK